MKTEMKKVTTYIENGREFIICKCSEGTKRDGYWAFENGKTIVNGVITTSVNGIAGFHSETLAETISRLSSSIKVDALEEAGIDRMVAVLSVMQNISIEEAQKVVNTINSVH